MGRKVAVAWHALFSIVAGVLYFLFALPRQWEMDGDISQSLGTALRIVTGAIIALAALPVVFTLLRTRKPEYGTPQLALTLRTSSIVLHVLSGVLIIGTAISEIWLDLDSAGQWLFGIYGAAAAIATTPGRPHPCCTNARIRLGTASPLDQTRSKECVSTVFLPAFPSASKTTSQPRSSSTNARIPAL